MEWSEWFSKINAWHIRTRGNLWYSVYVYVCVCPLSTKVCTTNNNNNDSRLYATLLIKIYQRTQSFKSYSVLLIKFLYCRSVPCVYMYYHIR